MTKRFIIKLNILISLLLAFCLMSADFCALAGPADRTKTVKMGYFFMENFMDGDAAGTRKTGYGYEYIQKLAYFTGWRYEYVYGDWTDLVTMLENGEIDMLADMSYTPERAEKMLFSEYPMGTENYYIYTRDDERRISPTDLSTLSGMLVGVTTASLQAELLEEFSREQRIGLRIMTFPNERDRQLAFIEGRINATAAIDMEAGRNYVPIKKLGSSDIFVVVSKERKDLYEELCTAQKLLYQTNPSYNEMLHNKYYSYSLLNKTLSNDEVCWIGGHSSLNIGYLRNEAPLCFENENGEADGAMVDFIEMMKEELAIPGIRVRYTPYNSYREMIKDASNGLIDAAFPVLNDTYSAEQQNVILTDSFTNLSMIVMYDDPGILRNTTNMLLAVSGSNYERDYLENNSISSMKIVVGSREEGFEKVEKGLADGVVVCSLASQSILNSYRKYKDFKTFTLANDAGISFAVGRDHVPVFSILNKGISVVSSALIHESIVLHQATTYSYSILDFVADYLGAIITVAVFMIMLVIAVGKLAKNSKMLRTALSAANAANAAKTDFLSAMSHDIRTPLNGIIGMTDIAKNNVENSGKLKECLGKIEISSKHLLSLINDVLDMSRIESGKTTINSAPLSMINLVDSIVTITDSRIKEKNIDFITDFDDFENPNVIGDEVHVSEIIINIIGNAVKFTDVEGQIKFSVKETKIDRTRVSYKFVIADNGIGMSDEFQKHIFEPFTQEVNESRTSYQGTGLGMAITKHLTELLGGTITLESKQGFGTTFTVEIPFEISDIVVKKKEEADAHALDGYKVLLAEDNEINREIAMELLGTFGACSYAAENGEIAVRMMKEAEPFFYDAILMDIRMPVMDGLEATRQIRDISRLDAKQIPIIAMSANAFEEDVRKSIAVGMNAHLSKPIDAVQVVNVLKDQIIEYRNIHRINMRRGNSDNAQK